METHTQRGRTDINEVIEYLRASLGKVPMDDSREKNRNNCSNLLKLLSKQYPGSDPVAGAKWMIDVAMSSWHKNNCTSVYYLYKHAGRIISEGMSRLPKEEPKQPYKII